MFLVTVRRISRARAFRNTRGGTATGAERRRRLARTDTFCHSADCRRAERRRTLSAHIVLSSVRSSTRHVENEDAVVATVVCRTFARATRIRGRKFQTPPLLREGTSRRAARSADRPTFRRETVAFYRKTSNTVLKRNQLYVRQ